MLQVRFVSQLKIVTEISLLRKKMRNKALLVAQKNAQ